MASSPPTFTPTTDLLDRNVTDPLSDVTRVDRRWLLITTLVVATMAYGGVVPSEIDALGLRASQLNPNIIFALAWLTALYFHVEFALYVAADSKAWKRQMGELKGRFIDTAIDQLDVVTAATGQPSFRESMFSDPDSEYVRVMLSKFGDLFEKHTRPLRYRAVFEIYFPLAISFANLPAALFCRLTA